MTNTHRLRRAVLLAVPAIALARWPTAAAVNEICVVARKFVWEPNVITVVPGQPVTLRFTAPEVPMGFSLPDFQLRTDIVPGKEAVVQFTPGKAGSFTFLCDVFCGNGHEDMSGMLVVRA